MPPKVINYPKLHRNRECNRFNETTSVVPCRPTATRNRDQAARRRRRVTHTETRHLGLWWERERGRRNSGRAGFGAQSSPRLVRSDLAGRSGQRRCPSAFRDIAGASPLPRAFDSRVEPVRSRRSQGDHRRRSADRRPAAGPPRLPPPPPRRRAGRSPRRRVSERDGGAQRGIIDRQDTRSLRVGAGKQFAAGLASVVPAYCRRPAAAAAVQPAHCRNGAVAQRNPQPTVRTDRRSRGRRSTGLA